MMKNAWIVAVFTMLSSLPFVVHGQDLAEAEVQALLVRLDQAFPAQDIETIAASLGDDVQIRSTMTIGTDAETYDYDKSSYLKALREGWAQMTGYRYRRANQRVVIAGDVATATADVVESGAVEGGHVTSTMAETVTIERVKGDLVVTRVVGTGRVKVEPR